MADFNPATMLDVSQDYYCSFTATRSGTDLLVTAKSYGDLLPGMVVTGSGIGSFIVQERLAVSGSELERWRTYNLTADFDAVLSKTTLTVSNVRSGTVSGRISLSIDGEYWWGIGTQSSGTAGGAGTYAISSGYGTNDGYQFSSGRWFSYALSGETVSSPTAMSGRLFGASTTAATSGESLKISRLGGAARYAGKALYFPPGAYTLILGMVGSSWTSKVALVGKSSLGAQRSVLRLDYSTTNPWEQQLNAKSLDDLYLDGVDPGNCKIIRNCYFWMPDSAFTITGGISDTTLTVQTVSPGGFVFVGAGFTGSGVTSFTVVSCLSGTPGGVGTYQISVSQNVANGTVMACDHNISAHYFAADTLASGTDYEIVGNTFDLPGVYIAVLVTNPRNALITRNKFPERMGTTSHVIRVDATDGLAEKIEVTYNKIDRTNITGIFAGSNRVAPIRNLVMDWNEVRKNEEEAIAIDGFGNNVGLCPCICNGRLSSITNDANGRVVVSLNDFIYATGSNEAPIKTKMTVATRNLNLVGYVSGDVFTATEAHDGYVAPGSTIKGDGIPDRTVITGIISRPGIGESGSLYRLNRSFTLGSAGDAKIVKMADWKKFMFIFSEGTGADGTIADIYDYDAANNTVTLDMFRSASLFTNGTNTWAGIHVGFFGGSCSHNKVSGDSKTGQNNTATYSTGISLYHNVFNFDVGHNEVSGNSSGIHVVGGHMLGIYHVLAYHNSLHDNVISNVKDGGDAVGVVTQYSGLPQRGNRLVNNTGIRANVILEGSVDDVVEGNILVGDNAKVVRTYVTPTLPATDL